MEKINVSNVFERQQEYMQQREKQLEAEGVKVFRLSTTERSEFKDCRRRWDFSSFSRQGMEPKKPHFALSFGTAIHHGLEMFYQAVIEDRETEGLAGKAFDSFWKKSVVETISGLQKIDVPVGLLVEPIDLEYLDEVYEEFLGKIYPEDAAEYNEMLDLGLKMLAGYETWSSLADNANETGFQNILYTEKEFVVAIPDPSTDHKAARFTDGKGQVWEMWLVGRLDMFVLDWNNRIWILDHKTSKDRLNRDLLILDDQMTKYLWAVSEIFHKWEPSFEERLAGCYYNVLRKKLPKVPEMLKSGKGLTKRKDIDTTYDIYFQAIIDNNLDPEDYTAVLEKLQTKESGFFERAKVHRNQSEIENAGVQLYMEAIDMLNSPYIYPHFTWDCRWKCDFKDLCLSMERNDDVEWLRASLFQKRKTEKGSVYDRESTIK